MLTAENKTNQTTAAVNKNPPGKIPFFQPKLTVNEPGDEYEREADRMAEQVMRMPAGNDSFFSPKPLSISRLQRKCHQCEEEEKLQRKPANDTIQRDNKVPDNENNNQDTNPFQLRTRFTPTSTYKPQLDYMPVMEELNYRGVPFPSSYFDDSSTEFERQYQFYKRFGLGKMAQKAANVPVLKLLIPDVSGDPDAALANLTTSLAVGSALRRDFPLETERDSTNMHVFNLKTFHFDLGGGGGPNVRRKCAPCPYDGHIERKENSSSEPSGEVSSYINALSSKGASLPTATRRFFEPRFGYDFSDVRIHNDNDAAKSAHSINALAYTVGNNIVFNQNQFSPESEVGKKLVAHELTHVVQQNSGLHTKQIQRFPWPFANQLNKEVDETVSETISNAPAAFNVWNGRFSWKSRFAIQLNATIGQVWLVMRLGTTAPRNVQRFWERAIYNKWSGNKYLKINIPGVSQGPCKFLIRVDIRWVTDPAKAHYTITPKAPGDNCGGRAGLGGTCSMTDWGTTENTDITHEFGHMIGNKEEYFTTDGQNFATGGRTGFRDADAGIMNNPADRAFLRHFNLLKNHVADMLGLPHSAISVIFNNESIPNCTPDNVDAKKQASI